MTPFYSSSDIQLFCGDSRLVLAELEPDSLDSCVTDPPYELSNDGKASPYGVFAEIMLPKNAKLDALLTGENMLPLFLGKAAGLAGIRFEPTPSSAMPVGSVAFDQEISARKVKVINESIGAVREPASDLRSDLETETPEHLGTFALKLTDTISLIDALNHLGTGFCAGGFGIGFGVLAAGVPSPEHGGVSVVCANDNIRRFYDALSRFILTPGRTENETVARFDQCGASIEPLTAGAALVFFAALQFSGAELIRAGAGASRLPPPLQASRISFVATEAYRAFSFDLITHPQKIGSVGFMGKQWDGSKVAYSVDFWREVLRVLKPGAHLLAFGGTRTSHRMVCAIEDAGFEIRDSLQWIYGSGFPKSLSVTKATQKVLQDRYGNKTCACLEKDELDGGTRLSSGNHPGCGSSEENGVQRSRSDQTAEETRNSDLSLDAASGANAVCKLREEDSAETPGFQEVEEAILFDGLRERGAEKAGLRNASLRAGVEEHAGENSSEGCGVSKLRKDPRTKRRSTSRSPLEALPIQRDESPEEPRVSLRELSSHNRIGNDSGAGLDTDKSLPRRVILDDYAGEQDAMARVCSWCGLPDSEWLKSLEPLGTALKPAVEPICLARKPLSEKTVAKNVLRWGTGGLNIDGSRIGTEEKTQRICNSVGTFVGKLHKDFVSGSTSGRWPANVLLSHAPGCVKVGMKRVKGDNRTAPTETREGGMWSESAGHPAGRAYPDTDQPSYNCVPECPVRLLDEQSGESVSSRGMIDGGFGAGTNTLLSTSERGFNDSGGASRFFKTFEPDFEGATRFLYTAKSSRSERNAGTEGMPKKHSGTYAQDEWSRQNMGNTPDSIRKPVGNHHPTVKPIDLMAYLIKLITPPGGTVLDCFAGSGSTIVAAKRAGFNALGIEMEPEYCEIIKARVANVNPLFAEPESFTEPEPEQLTL